MSSEKDSKQRIKEILGVARRLHSRAHADLGLTVMEKVLLLAYTKGMVTTLEMIIQSKEISHTVVVNEIKKLVNDNRIKE